MPKGSRGPRHRGSNRLWLQVHVIRAPEQWPLPQRAAPADVLRRLIVSVQDGSFGLPRGWDVELLWRNSMTGEMKTGEWTEVNMESTEGGRAGWSQAVLAYLYRQLARIEGLQKLLPGSRT